MKLNAYLSNLLVRKVLFTQPILYTGNNYFLFIESNCEEIVFSDSYFQLLGGKFLPLTR